MSVIEKKREEELLLALEEDDASTLADVTLEEIDNYFLLHAACEVATPNLVKQLIGKGASLHTPANTYMFPIESAAQRGDVEILRMLLENGAPVNPIKKLKSGWYMPYSPLLRAVDGNKYDAVKFLLEKGADQNIRIHAYLNSPLFKAVENNNNSIVQILLDYKPDFKWLKNKQAISLAAREGHVEMLKNLLEISKIKLKSVTSFKNVHGMQSPLEEATIKGNLKCINLLMEYGANPYACASGEIWLGSPILRAFKKGNLEVIHALLRGKGRFVLDWRDINQRYPDAVHIPRRGFLTSKTEASGQQEVVNYAKNIEEELFSNKE